MLLGDHVKNIQPETSPLVIHLPYGNILQSTHTVNLDLPWLPKASTGAHVVPGLFHASLVSIKILCDTSCKVAYDKYKLSILFKQHGSVVRNTGTFDAIVYPTTKYHNTTRQSPLQHKNIRHTVRWQFLPDHFQKKPHPIPPPVSFLSSQTNTHQGHSK